MQYKWIQDLENNIDNFLNSLNRYQYNFNPVTKGATRDGAKLELGLSCYALKIYYITGRWELLPKKEKENWATHINSFQSGNKNFPTNSFVDNEYVNAYNKFSLIKKIKDVVKRILNYFNLKSYTLKNEKLEEFVRAESKQAISSLIQVDFPVTKFYQSELLNEKAILDYLKKLNWQNAWNAGAQFSSLCVFVSTQVQDSDKKRLLTTVLSDFVNNVSNSETGGFYTHDKPEERELINGAMKVVTGLDWIGLEIPYPEKLIDTCLSSSPNMEGCDIVDIIYVLYRCNMVTNYRSDDIREYFKTLIDLIKNHYFTGQGGFSYHVNKSQTHYYGVKISRGLNTPDLHGTLLLIWGISMISKVIDLPISKWNILKP